MIDQYIKELFQITDKFIFPEYYSHEDKVMWKIENVYTNCAKEILVLCSIDDGIEMALKLAIKEIGEKKKNY